MKVPTFYLIALFALLESTILLVVSRITRNTQTGTISEVDDVSVQKKCTIITGITTIRTATACLLIQKSAIYVSIENMAQDMILIKRGIIKLIGLPTLHV